MFVEAQLGMVFLTGITLLLNRWPGERELLNKENCDGNV